ncbi:MAG: Lcl C-terminal domain-containing protein, partial [Planctomycetota bacterium]
MRREKIIKNLIYLMGLFVLLASPNDIKSAPATVPYLLLLSEPPIPLNELPQTGQIVCYEPFAGGDIIPCEGTGQDGESQAGVPWPKPRFTAITSDSSIDELTGLEWTNDRNAPGPSECLPNETKTWTQALDHIKCLNQNNYLGYDDWRLPNAVELSSLFNAAIDESFFQRFDQGSWGYWWTSTTTLSNPTFAYLSLAEEGFLSSMSKTEFGKIWPVRSGKPGIITLRQTGQNDCYDSAGVLIDCMDTGQDGDTLTGRPWPDPRFTDNGDETITDNLTGIVWAQNTNYPYSGICSPGTTDFSSAVAYIKCLNDNEYLGYNDWRLPNEIEVESLRNFGIPSSEKSNWLSNYGFYNFSSPYAMHWSSTVYVIPWSSTVEHPFGIAQGI